MRTNVQEPLVDTVRDLLRALRTLSLEQGSIARRNARRRVTKAAQRLLDSVAETYPTERQKLARRKARVGRVPDGYRTVSSSLAGMLAAAGVRVYYRGRKPNRTIIAPIWAVTILSYRPEKLQATKKNITERKALLAEIALKTGTY